MPRLSSGLILLLLLLPSIAVYEVHGQPPYYWVGEGAFFRYRIEVSDVSSLVAVDKSSGLEASFSPPIIVEWRIEGVSGDRARVNISLIAGDKVFSKLVDLDLRTMMFFGEGGEWLGEWIYVINPIFTGEPGAKILGPVKKGVRVDLSNESYYSALDQVEFVDSLVRERSGGSKSFSPLVYVDDRGVASVRLCNKTLVYMPTNPPPAEEGVEAGGFFFDGSRLVWGGVRAGLILIAGLPDAYEELLNPSYPITYVKLNFSSPTVEYPFVAYLIVDNMGEVYCLTAEPGEALFDSQTGVLIYARLPPSIRVTGLADFLGMGDLVELRVPERVFRYEISVWLDATSISFERPRIGGGPAETQTTIIAEPREETTVGAGAEDTAPTTTTATPPGPQERGGGPPPLVLPALIAVLLAVILWLAKRARSRG